MAIYIVPKIHERYIMFCTFNNESNPVFKNLNLKVLFFNIFKSRCVIYFCYYFTLLTLFLIIKFYIVFMLVFEKGLKLVEI